MRHLNTTRSFRIAAGIMGLMMLVFVLFSAFYIAVEADHDCCGEGCPICACIQMCENTLREIVGRTIAKLSALSPVLCIFLIAATFAASIPQETLVSGKVRLND